MDNVSNIKVTLHERGGDDYKKNNKDELIVSLWTLIGVRLELKLIVYHSVSKNFQLEN